MATFSRRFAPDTCYTLDSGSMLCFDNGGVSAVQSVRKLRRDGRFVQVQPQ
jgi:hypothetical protein